jgi:osmotically-inducible protein OsmY
VTHRADKRLAEDLAADVFGVHDVHNNIRVAPGR